MRFFFVVNGEAGRGRARRLGSRLTREFPADDVRVVTAPPGREEVLVGAQPTCVVAVGGDGTMQHVLQALGDPIPCSVGILPTGTANDLARAVGIPRRLGAACAVLRAGHTRRLDLAEVNGRSFATAGGIGLPARIARRSDRARSRSFLARGKRCCGHAVYLIAAAREILGRRLPLSVAIAGTTTPLDRPLAAVIVSNQPRFGGFRPSPAADPCDGRLDLCTIEDCGRLRMMWIAARVRRGDTARCPEVHSEQRASLTIVASRPVAFVGDGETLLRASRFEIRVRPRALPLVVPAAVAQTDDGRGGFR